VPDAVAFGAGACVPQTIQVVGQNDGIVDGDMLYFIDTLDEQDYLVDRRVGYNLDNDSYPGIAVNIQGPSSLRYGGTGVFMISARNIWNTALKHNEFLIQTTPGLAIKGYAASLTSGEKFKSPGKIKSGVLSFTNVELRTGDTLLISIDVLMNNDGIGDNKITAHFSSKSGEQQNDNDYSVGINLFYP
jgi:hypothetical protein